MPDGITSPQLAIDIQGLGSSYPDGTRALSDVDLRVEAGERLGLIGGDGAGKSTLLLHLNGLLRGAGTVRVLGCDVTNGDLRALRERVGLVFQNPDDQLFMPTVFDDVAYAPLNAGMVADEVRVRVADAPAQVGMSRFEAKSPLNLSVGQKKRVCIASVLATDNEALVLDEPSAGLGPAGRRDLISLLASFERTMVIATHDLSLVRDLCSRGAVMAGGAVIRTGPCGEVLDDPDCLSTAGL